MSLSTSLDWGRLPAKALHDDDMIAQAWDRLNAARLDLPFLSAAAMSAALAEFGLGQEQLFIARSSGRVVAACVLVAQNHWLWATFQPSQIPLGAWVAEADLELVALARSLLNGPLRWCLALSITQIDPFAAPRAPDDDRSHHLDYIETGWLDIEGSFADYWAARGKNLRQNLRKQRNKLAADSIRPQLRLLTAPQEMAPALARYGAMESAGWKAGEGTSIHPDNAQGRFYTRLFTEAARRSEALVCEYFFDDRSVAMNLCLLRGATLVVLKTTYDESIKTYSPASLLREEELQGFFARGRIRRIEYYGRLMEWHTKLTDRKRTLHHLTVYRWALLKTLAEKRRGARARTAVSSAPSPEPATNAST